MTGYVTPMLLKILIRKSKQVLSRGAGVGAGDELLAMTDKSMDVQLRVGAIEPIL